MRREIVRTDVFEASVAALRDCAETRLVLDMLILRARRWPHTGDVIPGSRARVLRARPYGNFPAIRLIYRATASTVYLYRADYYDVLATAPVGAG